MIYNLGVNTIFPIIKEQPHEDGRQWIEANKWLLARGLTLANWG